MSGSINQKSKAPFTTRALQKYLEGGLEDVPGLFACLLQHVDGVFHLYQVCSTANHK